MGCIQHFGVFSQEHGAQVDGIPLPAEGEVVLLAVGLVAQHLDRQHVGAARDFLDAGHARRVREREIRDQGIILCRQVGRGVGDRLVGSLLQHFDQDAALILLKDATGNELGVCRYRPEEGAGKGQQQFNSHKFVCFLPGRKNARKVTKNLRPGRG